MKLKILLNRSETLALETLLSVALATVTMEELREQPHQYVIAANLFGVLQKIKAKAEDMRMFGGDKFTLSLTRPEALAFDVWFNPADWGNDGDEEVLTLGTTAVKPQTYEYALIVRICGLVNKEYYT